MTESPIYIDRLTCGTLDTGAPRAAPPFSRSVGAAPALGGRGPRHPGHAPLPAPEPVLAPFPALEPTLAPLSAPGPVPGPSIGAGGPAPPSGVGAGAGRGPRPEEGQPSVAAGGEREPPPPAAPAVTPDPPLTRGLGHALGAALGLASPAAPHLFRGRVADGALELAPFAACGAWMLCVASDGAGSAVFALARASPGKAGSAARITSAPGDAGTTWEAAWPAGSAPLLQLRGSAQAVRGARDTPFEAVAMGCGPPAS